jgi:hypothetical protein
MYPAPFEFADHVRSGGERDGVTRSLRRTSGSIGRMWPQAGHALKRIFMVWKVPFVIDR